MKGRPLLRLLVLLAAVVVLDVLVLSPGLIGEEIGESAFATAVGVSTLLASALVVVYGCYVFLSPHPPKPRLEHIRTHDDYVAALSRYKRVKPLDDEIPLAIEQLERMRRKRESLSGVLRQRFDPAELSYRKFDSVTGEVEKLFYSNVRSILGRLNVFDEEEFKRVKSARPSPLSRELLQRKSVLYDEYETFVRHSLNANEEILLKLDQLILEVSRLDSFEPERLESLPCVQEIDSLIRQTKYYKP